jgi:hypothetical protein
MAVLHGVVGSRVKLTWALQGFVIIVLIVTATSRSFDLVDFVVIFMRPLSPKVITVVTMRVPAFSTVSIIVTVTVVVVNSPTVVAVIVSSWRVCGLFRSSHVHPDQLLRIVSIGVILGSGQKLGDRGWPLPK